MIINIILINKESIAYVKVIATILFSLATLASFPATLGKPRRKEKAERFGSTRFPGFARNDRDGGVPALNDGVENTRFVMP